MSRILALIPARGGSKGIPGKNIKLLGGKPLIHWTIEAAKKSRHIDRLIVSSEDSAILAAARIAEAETPFVRPAALATDEATSVDVALHALDQVPGFDWLLLLQPTSPFRSAADIDTCVELAQKRKSRSAVSVCKAELHPVWMYFMTGEQILSPVMPHEGDCAMRRQDLSPVYTLNGALYLIEVAELRRAREFVTEDAVGYVMPRERSIDIDEPRDWKEAERLLKL